MHVNNTKLYTKAASLFLWFLWNQNVKKKSYKLWVWDKNKMFVHFINYSASQEIYWLKYD